jgi:hypothetical protein
VTYKDKILALWYPVVTGIVFWIIYLYTQKVFIIEHSRVVMITSIFLLIVVGLGVQKSIDYILTKKNIVVSLRNSTIVKILVYVALVSVTILSISFQQWFRLSMRIQTPMGDYLLVPSPSVTRYITDSDIKIFSSYKNARFVSHPWKGLVIGSATQNIPLESKSSTLTNKLLRYEFFMKASCDGKKRLIDKYNIDLVYSTKIECPKYLELVERSSEGLVLYRPIRK